MNVKVLAAAVITLGIGATIFALSESEDQVALEADEAQPAETRGAPEPPRESAGSDLAVDRSKNSNPPGPLNDPTGADSVAGHDAERMAELARLMLGSSIQDVFPDAVLSSDDMQKLAAATVRLRLAETQLEQLESGGGDSELRESLSNEIDAAVRDIGEAMEAGLDPALSGEQNNFEQTSSIRD